MPKSTRPNISVIVSVLNGSKTLRRCIESVAAQTYPHRELIVIDGGSTDGTLEILQSNIPNLTYWVSEPDRGISHAWNKGLVHARGEWITFLGADDYLQAPDVLERLSEVLIEAYPPTRVVYGEVTVHNRLGKEVLRRSEAWDSAKRRFRQFMSIPHPGLMHHRSLFEEHGTFDESFRIAGDYDLLLRELWHNDARFVPNLVVAGIRHGGISATPVGRRDGLLECRAAQRKHGAAFPGALWIWEFAKAQLRVWLWRVLGARLAAYVFDLGRLVSGKGAYWTRQ